MITDVLIYLGEDVVLDNNSSSLGCNDKLHLQHKPFQAQWYVCAVKDAQQCLL